MPTYAEMTRIECSSRSPFEEEENSPAFSVLMQVAPKLSAAASNDHRVRVLAS